MLGHASVTVTLDTYSHAVHGIAKQAAADMDRLAAQGLSARQALAASPRSATALSSALRLTVQAGVLGLPR